MRILKHPIINAVFVGLISAIYSFVFIFTSKHVEFSRMLSKSKTLQSYFWNEWSGFIRVGNMKYIAYIIIGLTLTILMLSITKRIKKYDEYQVSILSKSLIIAGLLSIIMLPIMLVMLLSDSNYTIETIFLFAVIQWCGALIADLVYVIKY